MWLQRQFSFPPQRRGYHLVTRHVLEAIPEIEDVQVGLLHLFLQHTSASLTINENADPDVRTDMESLINTIVPEQFPYIHTMEGPDDMPAHMKSSLMGCSLSLPVGDGRLQLGVWQGIYLCEHRDRGGSRRAVATLHGDA